jgi:hypothetical protein
MQLLEGRIYLQPEEFTAAKSAIRLRLHEYVGIKRIGWIKLLQFFRLLRRARPLNPQPKKSVGAALKRLGHSGRKSPRPGGAVTTDAACPLWVGHSASTASVKSRDSPGRCRARTSPRFWAWPYQPHNKSSQQKPIHRGTQMSDKKFHRVFSHDDNPVRLDNWAKVCPFPALIASASQ